MFRVLLVDAKIQKHAQIAAVVSNFICNFTPTSTPTTIQPVMTINKTPRLWMSVLLMLMSLCVLAQQQNRLVIAYVCSWTDQRLPNPMLMTNINYAFGHVNKTFNGCNVQNPDFLRKVVALKQINPKLKIQLSVGGWTSGNFSEMAADAKNRMMFAKDCARIVKLYGLDGIDIDWEYPTSSEAGISSSPDDTKNFTLLMRDLRKTLGKDKLLTAATIADALYVDFRSCIQYMDFVNIMAYDVADAPKHHTTLFRSPLSGRITVSEAVDAHIKAGVPKNKLCLGLPLYGRGDHGNNILEHYMKTGYTGGYYKACWDSVGQVPYLADWSGQLAWAAENTRSFAAKCQYIIDRDLLGAMYWEATEDNAQEDLMNTVYLSLLKYNKATIPLKQVLVMTDGQENAETEHLRALGKSLGFVVNVFTPATPFVARLFSRHHLLYNVNCNMDALSADAKTAFERYIDKAEGSYLAYNADTTKHWAWYNAFFKQPQAKHARTILYKVNPNLGYMPRLSTYEENKKQALKWLLRLV